MDQIWICLPRQVRHPYEESSQWWPGIRPHPLPQRSEPTPSTLTLPKTEKKITVEERRTSNFRIEEDQILTAWGSAAMNTRACVSSYLPAALSFGLERFPFLRASPSPFSIRVASTGDTPSGVSFCGRICSSEGIGGGGGSGGTSLERRRRAAGPAAAMRDLEARAERRPRVATAEFSIRAEPQRVRPWAGERERERGDRGVFGKPKKTTAF